METRVGGVGEDLGGGLSFLCCLWCWSVFFFVEFKQFYWNLSGCLVFC